MTLPQTKNERSTAATPIRRAPLSARLVKHEPSKTLSEQSSVANVYAGSQRFFDTSDDNYDSVFIALRRTWHANGELQPSASDADAALFL